MRRPSLGLLFGVAAALSIALPATATGITLTNHIALPHGLTGKAEKHVVAVTTVAPSDRDDDGYADDEDDCPSTAYSSNGGCPPPPPAPEPTTTTDPAATSVSAPATTTVAGGCVGMEAESGSAGYSAMSSSGYIGCYQISPEHFTSGSCAGLGTDPAGQDACAAIICQTEGAGAWTNPSGQNPCGRLGG